ncbi:DUF3237 family protein [Amycolatopsis sp. NPDC001319]|uniref:DUF3237 family protein n=1 Tax=unclassified Amycolatopsis TaxID=2618356 RepID=UPI003687DD0F
MVELGLGQAVHRAGLLDRGAVVEGDVEAAVERLSGEVLPGGADFQLVRPDGVAEIDVRATLRTDHDDLVYLTGRGLRHGPADVLRRMAAGEAVHPDSYYFRECLLFEAAGPRTEWLNRVVTVARGARTQSTVKVDVFEVR